MSPASGPVLATGRTVARAFLTCAALSLLVGLGGGLVVALHYTPLSATLARFGLPLQALRPIHTGATAAWIFFGGMAVVYRWLFERIDAARLDGDPLAEARAAAVARRARVQLGLWVTAAVLAAGALLAGYSTGREYLEYPPALSIPIVVGWCLYAWNFASVTRYRLRTMPVYAWMWGTSVFLFLWTFAEANAWMLDVLRERPVRDMAIQWKAYGSLVGSFNLLVYGSLSWLGIQVSGSDKYARSNMAFALFLVGVLNSFTNYVHHTYHLPQADLPKWIAFTVSMLEAVILARVTWDCAGLARKWAERDRHPLVQTLMIATTVWTFVQLTFAILISVPPLNTWVHGTLAVVAHSMGSLIGIDSMALLAAGAWLVDEDAAAANPAERPVPGTVGATPRGGLLAVGALNGGLALLWLGLAVVGVRAGVNLVLRGELPWIGAFPAWLGPVLVAAGLSVAVGMATLVFPWLRRRPRVAAA